MASSMFHTRNKVRPRQSAVDELSASKPYEELAPSRQPIHVRTTSQALRGSVPSQISAPNTNPTLTSDPDEPKNKVFARTRDRSDREQDQLYVSLPAIRPLSLRKSPSTATDSSTVYSDSDKSFSHRRSTTSLSETSVSSGSGSTFVSDFGGRHSQGKNSNQQAALPTPGATTKFEHITSDPPPKHLHSTLHAARNAVHAGEFYFPRPSDDELELLFQEIKRSLDLGDYVPNMTLDQKWQMVYNAEHIRWADERKREQYTKKQAEIGQSVPDNRGSPEWYIQRFTERNITQKLVASLEVSLRTLDLRSILSRHPLPPVAEEFLAGLNTSSQYKVLVCLRKPSYR